VPNLAVAVVDSDVRIQNYMRRLLVDIDRETLTFDSGAQALEYLQNGPPPAVVFLASHLPDADHVDVIQQLRDLNPHIKIVVMPCVGRADVAVQAIRAGACQVLPKPFLPADLLNLVLHYTGEREPPPSSEEVELPIGNRMSLVYASPAMREVQRQAAMVANVNLPVLILGESGTGKEVIARYIHSLSRQAKKTFLKINCAAVPSELLESELFGYEPGAFTGAGRSKPGKFKLCDEGTMFLDEIGEMHASLQAKLLQVLQDGTFSPLGSNSIQKVNVRIIAATNVDMNKAIANKTFREDLYYRLNGFCFRLPPLRDRREDIPVLLRHFLRRYSQELGFSDVQPTASNRLMKACLRYDWPGNLRELESFVKRFLVLGDEQLMVDELAAEINEQQEGPGITNSSITQALQSAGGNRRVAAKSLGISYKVLLRMLRDFQIEPTSRNIWIT